MPRRVRAIVRARESIALAALTSALAGVVVAVTGTGADLLHRLSFQLDPGVRRSGLFRLDPMVAIAVPLAGGLVFGVAVELIARRARSARSARSRRRYAAELERRRQELVGEGWQEERRRSLAFVHRTR